MRCRCSALRTPAGILTLLVAAALACFTLSHADDVNVSAMVAKGKSTLFRAGNRYGGEAADNYLDRIQPIIGQRCTVCHGCENSPCSLKMVSYRGMLRGGTKIASQTGLQVAGWLPSRLQDGPTLGSDEEWKNLWQKGRPENQRFNPVLPESPAEVEKSLLYLFLKQGNEMNKPGFDRKAARELEQERYNGGPTQCVANAGEQAEWQSKNPQGGMPFGCPGLKRWSDGGYGAGEFDALEQWLKKGAPGPSPKALESHAAPHNREVVAAWEQYLNQNSPKQALVSRYLYEHLFRAHIHFQASPGEFYEMVRAANGPGTQPVDEMVTVLPNDAPAGLHAGKRVYYRLRKVTDLVTMKDHVVFDINSATLQRIQFLFEQEEPRWEVKSVPGYESKNPFLYFKAIPPSIRYKFLLDNSRFILENFTRSPVCFGTSATFAMDDYVWTMFVVPSADPSAQDSGPAAFTDSDWGSINDGSRVDTDFIQGRYALIKHNDRYLSRQEAHLRKLRPKGARVDDIWDGSCLFHSSTCSKKRSPKAWLSAIRHETNASILYGGEGGTPITLWLFNFTNFERAYYSLSFNYKDWGSAQHKLLTWRDFMHARIEAQDRFLSLMPRAIRSELRKEWSTGFLDEMGVSNFPDRSLGKDQGWAAISNKVVRSVAGPLPDDDVLVGVRQGDPAFESLRDVAPKKAFRRALDLIRQRRFSDWPEGPLPMNTGSKASSLPTVVSSREDVEAHMGQVTHRYGFFNSRLPSVSYIRILPEGWRYTLVATRSYAARNSLTDMLWARYGQSAHDYSVVYRGIVGDYPNLFFDIPKSRVAAFFSRLPKIATDAEWLAFRKEFMVQKNGEEFWKTVDDYHAWIGKNMPVYGGIFDLREYDNWEIPPESSAKWVRLFRCFSASDSCGEDTLE